MTDSLKSWNEAAVFANTEKSTRQDHGDIVCACVCIFNASLSISEVGKWQFGITFRDTERDYKKAWKGCNPETSFLLPQYPEFWRQEQCQTNFLMRGMEWGKLCWNFSYLVSDLIWDLKPVLRPLCFLTRTSVPMAGLFLNTGRMEKAMKLKFWDFKQQTCWQASENEMINSRSVYRKGAWEVEQKEEYGRMRKTVSA